MGESVHCQDGSWYFWDECRVDRYGPFETRQQAEDELVIYCTAVEIHSPAIPLDDDSIRAWWRKQGGRFYGPKVERGVMPEDQLLPALRRVFEMLNAAEARCERFAARVLQTEAVTYDRDGSRVIEWTKHRSDNIDATLAKGRSNHAIPADKVATRFKQGDIVRIVGPRQDDTTEVPWYPWMDELIGLVREVAWQSDTGSVRLYEHDPEFDPCWLTKITLTEGANGDNQELRMPSAVLERRLRY